MEVKKHIVARTMQMFLSNGIKAVRMDDIAAELGISKRTLYELFGSREDLIFQCVEYYFHKNEETLMRVTRGAANVIDEVWIVIKQGEHAREHNRTLVDNLRKFYPQVFEALLEKHHGRLLKMTIDMFKRGIREGFFMPDFNLEYFAEVFMNFLYGTTRIESGHNSADRPADPTALIYMMMLFLRGITTEIGRRYMDDNIMDEVKRMGNDKNSKIL